MQVLHAFVEHLVRFAGLDFVRTDRVGDFVHHVAAVQRVEDAEEEIEVHLQAGFGVGLAQTAGLLNSRTRKPSNPALRSASRYCGFIHAEAARAASAGGEEHVLVDDLLLADALLFQGLQVLHEVTDGEVGGIALAVVAVLFAKLECAHVGRGHWPSLVAEPFQRAMHQLLVFPSQPSKQQRGEGALVLGERTLHRPLEVVNLLLGHAGFPLQACALFSQPPLNYFLNEADLHQVGRR